LAKLPRLLPGLTLLTAGINQAGAAAAPAPSMDFSRVGYGGGGVASGSIRAMAKPRQRSSTMEDRSRSRARRRGCCSFDPWRTAAAPGPQTSRRRNASPAFGGRPIRQETGWLVSYTNIPTNLNFTENGPPGPFRKIGRKDGAQTERTGRSVLLQASESEGTMVLAPARRRRARSSGRGPIRSNAMRRQLILCKRSLSLSTATR
jgi:hypothetical protein